MYIIAVLIYLCVVFVTPQMLSPSPEYFDVPSILLLLLLTVPMLAASDMLRELKNAFGFILQKDKKRYSDVECKLMVEAIRFTIKTLVGAGLFGVIIGLINLLHNLSDPASIGPNCSMLVLSIYYAAFGIFLLLPIESRVKKEIIQRQKD